MGRVLIVLILLLVLLTVGSVRIAVSVLIWWWLLVPSVLVVHVVTSEIATSALIILILVEVVVPLLMHEGLADGVERVVRVGLAVVVGTVGFNLHWFIAHCVIHGDAVYFGVVFIELLEFD